MQCEPSVSRINNPRSESPVRKSAALTLNFDDSVSIWQFRYGGGGPDAKVTSLGLAKRDGAAKAKMRLNKRCTSGDANREWMENFLKEAEGGN